MNGRTTRRTFAALTGLGAVGIALGELKPALAGGKKNGPKTKSGKTRSGTKTWTRTGTKPGGGGQDHACQIDSECPGNCRCADDGYCYPDDDSSVSICLAREFNQSVTTCRRRAGVRRNCRPIKRPNRRRACQRRNRNRARALRVCTTNATHYAESVCVTVES